MSHNVTVPSSKYCHNKLIKSFTVKSKGHRVNMKSLVEASSKVPFCRSRSYLPRCSSISLMCAPSSDIKLYVLSAPSEPLYFCLFLLFLPLLLCLRPPLHVSILDGRNFPIVWALRSSRVCAVDSSLLLSFESVFSLFFGRNNKRSIK